MINKPLMFRQLEKLSFQEIHTQLEKIKLSQPVSFDHDLKLTFVLANLISIEEHLVFTGTKTGKNKYYELINHFQPIKNRLIQALKIERPLQETAERFLAGCMRLMEVGTKQYCFKDQETTTMGSQLFSQAYQFYLLFESLRHGMMKNEPPIDFDQAASEDLNRYLANFFDAETRGENKPGDEPPVILRTHALKIDDLNTFIEKADSMKKQHQLDLSSDQDLTLGVMNLIVIEEDLFLLGARANSHRYYDLLCQVREIRKACLHQLVTRYEGEVWCISKHLLSASMRLMQVGFQMQAGEKNQSWYFQMSYDLYSLFWGINLGVVGGDARPSRTKKTLISKLGELAKKAIDCCIE